ncbi:unnamed protein product [Brassica oleracea var. botrytis]
MKIYVCKLQASDGNSFSDICIRVFVILEHKSFLLLLTMINGKSLSFDYLCFNLF